MNKLLIFLILIALGYYLYQQSEVKPIYYTKSTQTSLENSSNPSNNLEIENSLDKLIAEIQQLNKSLN